MSNTLFVFDAEADLLTLTAAMPEATAHLADNVLALEPDDAGSLADALDVVGVLPADAGPAARARVQDAVRLLTPTAHTVRVVTSPGSRLTLPEGLDTPGAVLAWLLSLPELGSSGPARPLRAESGRRDEDDDDAPLPAVDWPEPPGPEAYHGPAGEAVRRIEAHTEADPAAILAQLLVAFGNAVGRGPHMIVDGARHGLNEFASVVGRSAAARKGTSKARALDLLDDADPEWKRTRVRNGLSSGEGLITQVRDPVEKAGEIVDEGEPDKRLLIIETEFGSVLRALQREGNRLSALLRSAWDGEDLATMTRTPLRATAPHVSLIGHITFTELRQLLSAGDISNGLANRIVWVCARRTRHLPFGSDPGDLATFRDAFRDALDFSRGVGRMHLTDAARNAYEGCYVALSTPPPGVLGEVTSRATAHVLRLSMVYALIDRSRVVDAPHVLAALALVHASNRAARHIFGDSLGNADADKILAALREAPHGLTRSEIRDHVLGKHTAAPRRNEALGVLVHHGLVREVREAGKGRPPTRYLAIGHKGEKGGKSEKALPAPVETPLSALNALSALPPGGNPAGPTPRREVIEL